MRSASDPLSVFLVDDDKIFLNTLTHEVKERFEPRMNVKTFTSGEEAMSKMDEHPDVVVLDFYLENKDQPGAMNGLDVLKKIKSVSEDTKVIMLSAQDRVEVASAAIKAGAYDYVTKSESTLLRLQNIFRNTFSNASILRESRKYEKRNFFMAAGLLLLIIFDIVYYLSH